MTPVLPGFLHLNRTSSYRASMSSRLTHGSCLSLPVSTPNVATIGEPRHQARSVSAQGYHVTRTITSERGDGGGGEDTASFAPTNDRFSGLETNRRPSDAEVASAVASIAYYASTSNRKGSAPSPSTNIPTSTLSANTHLTLQPIPHRKGGHKLHETHHVRRHHHYSERQGISEQQMQQKHSYILSKDNQLLVDQIVSQVIQEALDVVRKRKEKEEREMTKLRERERQQQGNRHRSSSRRRRQGRQVVKDSCQQRSRSQSEFPGRRTPTLFARADRFYTVVAGPPSSSSFTVSDSHRRQIPYISLHDLPNAKSFSHHDDTRSDSLEDLIQRKVDQIERRVVQSKSLDYLTSSPDTARSRSRPDFCRSAESGDFVIGDGGDSEYDSMELLSSFTYTSQGNVRFVEQEKIIDRQSFEKSLSLQLSEQIISSNLNLHFPDDMDTETITIPILTPVVTTTKSVTQSTNQLNAKSTPLTSFTEMTMSSQDRLERQVTVESLSSFLVYQYLKDTSLM